MQAVADQHRELDPVWAGQRLSERQPREIRALVDPAAPLHDVAIEPAGGAAAEAGAADAQERKKQAGEPDSSIQRDWIAADPFQSWSRPPPPRPQRSALPAGARLTARLSRAPSAHYHHGRNGPGRDDRRG